MSLLRWIDDTQPLPHPSTALGPGTEAPGLVAAGGSVTPARLDEAYRAGIFPWYSPGQPVLWWSPDPRMVLPVAEFRLAPSLRKTLRRFLRTPGCEVRFDHDVRGVIGACAHTPREGQDGTWIVPAMVEAYCEWAALGHVHSAETWVQGRRVGGLYAVQIGRMVYGESMFSHATDASKIALAALVAACRRHGIAWIDCQQNTRHLGSLGAREVPRDAFLAHVARASGAEGPRQWTYDPADWGLLLPTSPATGTTPPVDPPDAA
jgi:leucyl/phenylalanyl-tRNA---protein transferase